MKSVALGESTSPVEVSNISPHGFWLLLGAEELFQRPNGSLAHFDWVGYVVMAIALVTLVLMYRVHKQVPEAVLG